MYRESEGVMEKNSLIQKIQSIGIEKLIGEKQIVFSQGDKAEAFGYIVEGEVRAYRMDDQGREKEVGRFLSGTYFGEVILFASETYPVFAETVTPSRILFFRKERLLSLLRRDAAIAEGFLKLLAQKCLSLNSQMEAFTLKTVRERLAQYLLSHCSGGNECTVTLTIPKTRLAGNLGTISETLSRNLRQLQEDGIIEVRHRDIIIKNCERLKKEMSTFS